MYTTAAPPGGGVCVARPRGPQDRGEGTPRQLPRHRSVHMFVEEVAAVPHLNVVKLRVEVDGLDDFLEEQLEQILLLLSHK